VWCGQLSLRAQKKKKDEATSAAEFLKKLDEAYERKQAEDKLTKEDEIMYTFRRLLKEWEQELAERPEAEKRTAQVPLLRSFLRFSFFFSTDSVAGWRHTQHTHTHTHNDTHRARSRRRRTSRRCVTSRRSSTC
jgi:curved DNA-binding protein CbpA